MFQVWFIEVLVNRSNRTRISLFKEQCKKWAYSLEKSNILCLIGQEKVDMDK